MSIDICLKEIESKLKEELQPQYLKIIDDSALHVGHSKGLYGKVSHILIIATIPKLQDLSPVKQHQAIKKVVYNHAPDLHSVSIKFV